MWQLSSSLTPGPYRGGGADGSLIKFSDLELTDPANKGLHDIINSLKHIADHYDVSYGDIIQFAGAVGFSNCPGATRLEFFAGRPEATAPAPPKLIPGPTDTAQATLSRMQDAGFSAEDTVILLGAHSVGREHTIDPAANDTPLDSTPGAFDSQFYLEVLLKGTVYPRKAPHSGEALSATKDVFRLSSDAAIARHPDTACAWQSYIGAASVSCPPCSLFTPMFLGLLESGHDDRMRSAFRKAMIKVATLGHRMEDLVDCSHVIPVPPPWNKTASYPAGFSTSSVERSYLEILGEDSEQNFRVLADANLANNLIDMHINLPSNHYRHWASYASKATTRTVWPSTLITNITIALT
ncbi:heme peroxidase [Lentinus tigrinus ALCF2SS1-7]|uniref:heme peroxidase n=1 Tax=Lentinus tigrinus ALCF2SS1-7 TaxID=1328758 RepID=UPI001165E020|nr:heme peroxidase [Lentinus tigrinus ALCF2SS1-7]